MFYTGIAAIDFNPGVTGLAPGVIEITGGESSGKTTTALSMCRETIMSGGSAAYISMEECPDSGYLRSAGHKDIIVAIPRYGETAFETAYGLINSGVKLVIIDSSDACVPFIEVYLDAGERILNAQKRLLFHCVNVLSELCRSLDSLVVVISQVRTNFKLTPPRLTTSTYSVLTPILSGRITLHTKSANTEYGVLAAKTIIVYVDLTKYSGYGELVIYPHGINRYREILSELLKRNIAIKRGAYFKLDSETMLGPGYKLASAQLSVLSNLEEYITLLRDKNG